MSIDWDTMLLAYLHDPPDKALLVSGRDGLPGHESRRLELAKALLGNDAVSQSKIKKVTAEVDVLAAQVERLPMPKGQHVNVGQHTLRITHPLSGDSTVLSVPQWNSELFDQEKESVRQLAKGVDGHGRFACVWRSWGDELARKNPCFARLPAETRTPDHTIWHHLDITAAFKAALSEDGGAAFLAFALGPVQRFIEAARSVRDLWSGSMILSWLAFRAMLPIIEQLGPTALVYPALRGIPLVDLWLRDEQRLGEKVPLPPEKLRPTPCLPHRFLALVPWGTDGATAWDIAKKCREAADKAVKELADEVKKAIQRPLDDVFAGWDKRWDSQITSYFSFSTAVVPLGGSDEEVDGRLARLLTGKDTFKEAFEKAEAVREMARSIPPDHQPFKDPQTGQVQYQDHAGRWQYQVELVQHSLAAFRTIRHVPPNPPVTSTGERFPQKCTLLGSFEQMGPDDLKHSHLFWEGDPAKGIKGAAQKLTLREHGGRLRKGEALCAVAMVRRCAPKLLGQEVQIDIDELWYWDTWTVAAADWLAKAEIDPGKIRQQYGDWNGHWLHWPKRDFDLDEADACPEEVFAQIKQAHDRHRKPPVYYAILKLDGDDLGGWLRGANSPPVRKVMHPDLVQYYEGLGQATKAGLDAPRPVGPALHAAISTALASFALHVVPHVVEKHHGAVIYSGGDDTLVLLPVSTVLRCALELQQVYTTDWYTKDHREYLMMGARATLSGGLVVVHAKDDLRLALQDARRAEKQAKESGRDALAITVRRRSGEHTTAVTPWSFVPAVAGWTAAFQKGASGRWAYHLYANRPTLEKLPEEAIKAEMRRQLGRAEGPTPGLIPPGQLAEAFDKFRASTVAAEGGMRPRFESPGLALNQFLTLCHTASFLARGRDG